MQLIYTVGDIEIIKTDIQGIKTLEVFKNMGNYMEQISTSSDEASKAIIEMMNLENGYESRAVLNF